LYHILIADDDMTRSPKFVSTEDETLRSILQEYSNFFKNFRKVVTLLSYDRSPEQRTEVESIIDKYAPVPLDLEWLITPSANVIPFFMYYLKVDKDDVAHPTDGWRLVEDDPGLAAYLTRTTVSDFGVDMAKVLQFYYPKTMALDDALAAIIWGNFIKEFIGTDQGTKQNVAYHFAKSIMDTNLGEFRTESNGAAILEDLTEDLIYGIFSKVDDGDFEDYWHPEIVDENAILTRGVTNAAGLVLSTSGQGTAYQSHSMNVLLAKKMNYHNEPLVNIDKWWAVEFWKKFFNPLMSKPDEPKNESGLTAKTYNSEKDDQKLTQYKGYLIKMVDFEKGQGNNDRAESFATTARKVEELIKKLGSEPETPPQEEPPGGPPDGEQT
jgi:hypothetical protein